MRVFGLFSISGNIVDQEQVDWIIEQSAWLDINVGFPNEPVPLITPTEQFFSRPPSDGHARALHVFEEVKALMGLQKWPCVLEAQEDEIDPRVGDLMLVQNAPQSPLGTFGLTDESEAQIVITYSPGSVENIHTLIATFAHELSHYVLAGCEKPRTCPADLEEHLTDLLAIKSGFGLFLANTSFNFAQYSDGVSQGWRTSAQGYLTEHEIVFALSVFMSKYDHDLAIAKTYLKPHLFKLLKRACRA